jgi:quercetin dioxygenase-like cupin family protein
MRWLLLIAASVAASTATLPRPSDLAAQAARDSAPRAIIDNPRVRVYRRAADDRGQLEPGPGVVVSIDDSDLGKAVWADDLAALAAREQMRGAIVIVQPRARRPPSPAAGSKPGDAPFTGMSFKPMFENDRVSVIRARMEVGAREGFHTHGSDTLVVHLSGGEIEDTADGKTVVNRWTRGDVEFEAFGSSHSARNVGAAVDVVLVALKP